MRKFVMLCFLFCYLSAIFGVAKHEHYCGRTLTSTYILSFGKKCACDSGDEMPACCKEKVSFKKIDDKQKHATICVLKDKIAEHTVFVRSIEVPFFSSITCLYTTAYAHAPPPKQGRAIYLLQRQFLI